MKDASKRKFDSMGKLHNDIVALIDGTSLTPAEVFLVLESISSNIKHLLMSMASATRREK